MEQIGQHVRFCGVKRALIDYGTSHGQCLDGYVESFGPESQIDQECPLSIRVDNTELQLCSLLS